ncbi:aminotransferase class V-fold PLP-dependent enzyme, partial [bacterium]|nr:aminotransferase class V-fold PLP-dependent enzyme [bacterium]
ETREGAARFLNADVNEIIFTKGTTDGINLIAQSYGKSQLKPGDEILISEMEHHSNIVPWQLIANETGAELKVIPMDEACVLKWQGCITERTKIVSIAHISNVTGTINPIAEIAKAAHEKGAILVVDGAQAAPYLKIDVKALDCDFYAFSGHKCYGPTGVGILYGKSKLLQKMPPITGGGDMIDEVYFEKTTYQEPPLRFEAGTPNIAAVVALKTALEFTEQSRKQDSLLEMATQRMQEIPGLKIIGTAPFKGPIITFHIEGLHPLDIATFLDLKQIAIRSGHLCAQPALRKFGLTAAARVSFGIYNEAKEVDQLVDNVISVIDRLLLA